MDAKVEATPVRNQAVIRFHGPTVYLATLAVSCVFLIPHISLASPNAGIGFKANVNWWILVPMALGLLGGVFSHPGQVEAPVSGKRVLLHNDGMLDWRLPSPGVHGVQRSGMFGLLPIYLDAAGYDVERMATRDVVTSERLREADVFVVINPGEESLMVEEAAAIWEFVEQGGGLLVLGDHTDLNHMMEPLNLLLKPVGIQYRFDSAFSVSRWDGDYDLIPHALTRNVDWSNEVLQQGTGASLEVGQSAYPLVIARYAFSDAGDRENNANGYLGDYRYQKGEPLGDLVIVAGAEFGQGRVIAFGDTSAFQNIAMPHSAPFVVDVVDALAAQDMQGRTGLSVTLVCLVAMLLVFVIRRWRPLELATGSICMVLGNWLVATVTPNDSLRFDHPNLAFIEAAQVNRFTLGHWERESFDGLSTNLARAGYLPLIMRSADTEYIDRAAVLISIAPQKPHSTDQVQRLYRYVYGGGRLILAVGFEERGGAEPLLDEFGYTLDSRPLGPVPVLRKTSDPQIIAEMQRHPQFHEAWGVVGDFDEVLLQASGLPIVGIKAVGDGKLVLIGDSYFLLDRALESENRWWLGNIRFVQKLLARIADPTEARIVR